MGIRKNTPALLLLIAGLFSVISCDPDVGKDLVVKGLRPVYAQSDWQEISIESPHAITQLGKLAMKGGYLYVNERMKGIHIIDNRNPEDPIPVGFIDIPGNTDFDFKGDMLYADNFSDLVAIRMLPDFNIEITERIEGLYKSEIPSYPANHNGYFECADPSKGFVIDWIEVDLLNPKCRR